MPKSRSLLFLAVVFSLGGLAVTSPSQAKEPVPLDPGSPFGEKQAPAIADAWITEFHTGYLTSIGHNASPLTYTLLPQLLVGKTPAHWRIPMFGSTMYVRSRGALEISPVIDGPESYFIGATFAPSLEWISSEGKWTTFFSAGGGGGLMDSKGYEIPGGQGQDFNLTWFIHAGVNWQLTERLSASVGARFQHISNGGQDEINPGLDAFGPTLGLSWKW